MLSRWAQNVTKMDFIRERQEVNEEQGIWGQKKEVGSYVRKELQAKKCRWPLQTEKGKETDFLLKTPEGPQPRLHTDFKLWTSRTIK